jgi:hypothetical protein
VISQNQTDLLTLKLLGNATSMKSALNSQCEFGVPWYRAGHRFGAAEAASFRFAVSTVSVPKSLHFDSILVQLYGLVD